MWLPPIKKISNKRLAQLKRNYNGQAYREWRKFVIKRDGGQCQMPGCQSTKSLEVHHIKRFADVPVLKTNKNNGITLCKKCHKSIQANEQAYELMFVRIVCANTKRYDDECKKSNDPKNNS